jgi:hypothetical protein
VKVKDTDDLAHLPESVGEGDGDLDDGLPGPSPALLVGGAGPEAPAGCPGAPPQHGGVVGEPAAEQEEGEAGGGVPGESVTHPHGGEIPTLCRAGGGRALAVLLLSLCVPSRQGVRGRTGGGKNYPEN